MHINLVWDANALLASQTFRDTVQAAATMLEQSMTDSITVNLKVGYGEYSGDGSIIASNISEGGSVTDGISYSDFRAKLVAGKSTPDDATALAHLPTGSSVDGNSSFSIARAQEKAFGIIGANDTAIDGYVGFGTGFTGQTLFAGALHELTHAMGRQPGLAWDLFRFTSAGHRYYGNQIPAAAAYFSIDGGVTHLADYGMTSDPSDFLNSSTLNTSDPFNEGVGSTSEQLTRQDLTQMDVIGFHRNIHFIAGDYKDNTLTGTSGDDRIYGDNGNDTLIGGGGADYLDGGLGNNTASYSTASSAVIASLATGSGTLGDANGDTFVNIQNLTGSNFDDILTGDGGANTLLGLGGNDLLKGGGGADHFDGGTGNNTVSYFSSAFGVNVNLGAHTASGGDASGDTLVNIQNLTGSDHNDTLVGDANDNTLSGGGGDDMLIGGAGADHLDGGAGTNSTTYVASSAAVIINLTGGTGAGGDATGDTLVNIQKVTGSNLADIMTGGPNEDWLSGAGGDDLFKGGGGADHFDGGTGTNTVSYINSSQAVIVSLQSGTGSGGDAAGDTYVNIQNLTGSGNNDILVGNTGSNSLQGGGGDDTLKGGGGADKLDGGAGVNTASYINSTAGVSVNLATGAASGGEATGDTFANIQNLTGSGFDDVLTGDANANTISGGGGSDTLYGGGGADTLYGGGGFNTLDGGAGADTLNGTGGTSTASYADATTGVTVNLLTPALNTGDAAGDVYVNIHAVQGSGFDDTITGDNAGDTLSGGDGNDTITGGTGNDKLYGNAGADTLIGGGGTDILDGGAGADTLNGVGGTATADYGDASAGLTVNLLTPASNTGDAAGDVYINVHRVNGSTFNDTLVADNAGDVLNGMAGDDTVIGGAGSDTLYGGTGADTLKSGTGSSILDGGAGADTLDGTTGFAFASYGDATTGVTVNLLDGSSNTGDAVGDTFVNLHRVMGSAFADTITADNAGDTLYGLGGSDTIVGGTGNDFLFGNAATDSLAGGAGTNYLDGGAGADRLDGTGGTSYASYSDATVGVVASLLNPGANTGDAAGDFYLNIHNVQGSGFADTIVGDNAGDQLYGMGGGDTITGGTGNDRLFGGAGDDTLTGGGGTDYLDGGAGADTLDGTGGTAYASYSDATAGVTVSLINPGADTGDAAGDTFVNVHNVQGSNLADTIVGDNAGDLLYGMGGGDTITGGTGSDKLYGGGGADTLIGGAGTNYLDGGAGADTLDGTGGTSYASYADAAAGVTVNLLTPSLNTGDAAGDVYINIRNVQGSNLGDTIVGDNSGDLLYGQGGADKLVGGTGNDSLFGGAGADTLVGGAGVNYLDGGAGADVLDGTGGSGYASYVDATAGVTVNLLAPGSNTGDAAGDSYIAIRGVQGSGLGDTITGDDAGDVINGAGGADIIVGGAGADMMSGGGGADKLTGGGGADRFVYANPVEGGDTITDFNAAEGDTIVISHLGFGGGLPASGLLPTTEFVNGLAATSPFGQVLWDSGSSTLSWDSDGTGAGSAVTIAQLTGVTTFAASSIRLT